MGSSVMHGFFFRKQTIKQKANYSESLDVRNNNKNSNKRMKNP